nr:MAG TPA: hypothetical protein [Inoviridae sp.]
MLVLAKIKPVEAVPHGALLPVFQCYIFHKHKSYLLCEITLIFIGHFLYLFAQINIQTNAFYNGIL